MNLDIATFGSPTTPPYRCSLCPANETPILDTGVEFTGLGRLYLCKRCSRDIARMWGFSRGKALDKLMEASAVLEQKEREMEDIQEMVRELTDALKVKDVMIKSLEAELQQRQAEVDHMNLVAKQMKESASAVLNA